jgi:hypothetical protein
MPKKPPRNNQRNRAVRTVQSAATVLQRLAARREGAGISVEKQALEKALLRVPATLRSYVVGAIDRPDELVIFMESAAWAARLKLALADAANEGARTTVKVAPRGAAPRTISG